MLDVPLPPFTFQLDRSDASANGTADLFDRVHDPAWVTPRLRVRLFHRALAEGSVACALGPSLSWVVAVDLDGACCPLPTSAAVDLGLGWRELWHTAGDQTTQLVEAERHAMDFDSGELHLLTGPDLFTTGALLDLEHRLPSSVRPPYEVVAPTASSLLVRPRPDPSAPFSGPDLLAIAAVVADEATNVLPLCRLSYSGDGKVSFVDGGTDDQG